MAELAVRVEGLGKRYQLGIHRGGYGRLTESLTDAFRSPLRRRPSAERRDGKNDILWAIRDVSFDVNEGDVVGIIGRNGAGKTTLLKILSRITEPTEGEAELRGRVGALLEVGTGFHPELTGRENIFLNGAILGMRNAEIKARFDAIVEFAEVSRFIDTPVKRYSSGMYVRLAFAVAAHLEPEVLVVDEVLAVGDAAFQKKCLGKLSDVAGEGRTVLFVSHNMGAVKRLCHRAVMLEGGRVVADGDVNSVVGKYLEAMIPTSDSTEYRAEERSDVSLQVTRVALETEAGAPANSADLFEQLNVRVEYVARQPLLGSIVSLGISRDGTTILNSFDTDLNPERFERREAGRFVAVIPLPAGLFAPGIYTVSLSTGVANAGVATDLLSDVISFEVTSNQEDLSYKSYSRGATVIARLDWQTEQIAQS